MRARTVVTVSDPTSGSTSELYRDRWSTLLATTAASTMVSVRTIHVSRPSLEHVARRCSTQGSLRTWRCQIFCRPVRMVHGLKQSGSLTSGDIVNGRGIVSA